LIFNLVFNSCAAVDTANGCFSHALEQKITPFFFILLDRILNNFVKCNRLSSESIAQLNPVIYDGHLFFSYSAPLGPSRRKLL